MPSVLLDYELVGDKTHALLPANFDQNRHFHNVLINGITLLKTDYTINNSTLEINDNIDDVLEFQWYQNNDTTSALDHGIDITVFPLRITPLLKMVIESLCQLTVETILNDITVLGEQSLQFNATSIKIKDFIYEVCAIKNPTSFRISENFYTITLVYDIHSIVMTKIKETLVNGVVTLIYRGEFNYLPCEFSIQYNEQLGECEYIESINILTISPLLFTV